MTSPFVTVEELAGILRVPKSRIYEWHRTRQIPAYRPGKRLAFDLAEVLSWFKQTFQTQQPSPTDSGRRRRRPLRQRRARGGQPGATEFKAASVGVGA
jgi:excisionase family DNA binding protein